MLLETARACLITGASGGVGTALAEAFHEAGYFVVGTDKVHSPNKSVDCFIVQDLRELVEDVERAEEFFLKLEQALGDRGLSVLVNNAALQVVAPVSDLTTESWQATLDVNVVAPFLLAQRLLNRLSGGSIINISSIHARLTKKNFVAYATSKAALSGMTRALAIDIGDKVRVNAIEPAALDTDMLRAGFDKDQAGFDALAGHHPGGRIGEPREVGRLAVAIAGADLPFLNGSVIGLDGGISARLHDPS